MAKYFPEPPLVPLEAKDRELVDYIFRELNRISVALFTDVYLNLEKKFVEPDRPQEGDVTYADGTSWNPGSGEGIYAYIAGAWRKLNLASTDDITIDDLTVDDITANDIVVSGTFTFPQSTSIAPTAEGSAGWDTDDDLLRIGDGTNSEIFPPVRSVASVATTSGTSIEFTGIPSWATQIILNLYNVSTSGTSPVQARLGDSGGLETTGYAGGIGILPSTTTTNVTVGFQCVAALAASVRYGKFIFDLIDAGSNRWSCMGLTWDGTNIAMTTGAKELSAVLDRVGLGTSGGTDTFDLGSASVTWR